jgi:predicted transposase/invertase (TIGR01784 family)
MRCHQHGGENMTARYINPYTDFGFKRLFGEEANKDLLIDFLNTFLPEKHQVKTMEFRNPEHLGVIASDRKAVFDIFCKAENGEQFIVEMQNASQRWFKDRILHCAACAIRDQAPKGLVDGKDWNYELRAVYVIAILGFDYDKEKELRKLKRDIHLKDQDGELFYDKLHFIFLQMPLFKKAESELQTKADKWMYFLQNLESLDDIPAILREPVFEQAFETAEIARMSRSELQAYEAHLKAYRDNYAVIETALFDGEARGEANKAREIARNLKQEGLSIALIAKTTGLSEVEIEQLK